MADEIKKTTTTKKRTTTSKPKVEEPKPTSIEEQMAQMMAMMMAQQQQLMELMAKTQLVDQNVEKEEIVSKTKTVQDKQPQKKVTKQTLRRDYKNVEIYVTNVSTGIVTYSGRNTNYRWNTTGDVEPMTIDDIINMPKKFLNTPLLCITPYENEHISVDEIIDVLNVRNGHTIAERIEELESLDMNSSESDIVEKVKEILLLGKEHSRSLQIDLFIYFQNKIKAHELTNMHVIHSLETLLGRKFL